MDLMIKGGRIVDGTGLPAFAADVAIEGERIARIGRVDEPARRVLKADLLVVCSGFINVHTHYDAQLDWACGQYEHTDRNLKRREPTLPTPHFAADFA